MNILMNKLIDDIKNKSFDITYIGIGSAIINKNNQNNNRLEYTQQFPPWLQKIYNNTTLTIRIINIDNNFENPYILSNLTSIKKINDDVFVTDRLHIYYLNLYFDDVIIEYLNKINKIIMEQKKLLLSCNYTGDELNKLENYFHNMYNNTEFFNDFKNYICYDYTTTPDLTGKYLDLYKQSPIININDKKIRKINIETIDNELIYNEEIKNKLKNRYIYELNKFITEYNIYDKLKNYLNYDENINNICITKSIFKNIDLNNFTNITIYEIMINKLQEYKRISKLLYKNSEYLDIFLDNLIDDITELNKNEWINSLIIYISYVKNTK
jgi:hypothetical protein